MYQMSRNMSVNNIRKRLDHIFFPTLCLYLVASTEIFSIIIIIKD